MNRLLTLMHGVLNVFYPPRCAACRTPLRAAPAASEEVCRRCWDAIAYVKPPLCKRCGRHIDNSCAHTICTRCMRTTLHFDRAFAPCLYEGTVKELICRMKYTRAPHLARPLSELMINHIHKHRLDTSYLDMLIPIPLHPAKLRERTFNQAQALAEPLAQALSLPCRPGLLRRGRHTRTQTNLDRLRRSANVEDSFRITDPAAVCNAHILLVDDVYTTGATCSAAARALKEAGARIVHAMTLAH